MDVLSIDGAWGGVAGAVDGSSMEQGRAVRTPVVDRPRPDSPNREDDISIDLPAEAAAAPPLPRRPDTSADELPEALRGMYYTG